MLNRVRMARPKRLSRSILSRRARWLSALFIVVGSSSVIAHLPASIALHWATLPESLQIQSVSGTVWHGQAQRVRWQKYDLGELNWHLQGWRLLTAHLDVDVQFGRNSDWDLMGKGHIGYGLFGDGLNGDNGLSGAYVRDVVVSLPAQQVLQWVALPVPVDATGRTTLTLKSWAYQAPYCQHGDGNLRWDPAQLQTPLGELNLERVTASIQCENSALEIQGKQQSAQLQSAFSLQLAADHTFVSQAWFKPEAEFPAPLRAQLDRLPEPDAQGRYHFQRRDQW